MSNHLQQSPSGFGDVAYPRHANSTHAPRLANGEPLGLGGLATLPATLVIMLSIIIVTPGFGG